MHRLLCLSASLLLAVLPISVAANTNTQGTTVFQQTTGMHLDCVNMTARVHAYAVSHGYCPPTGSGVAPYSTTYGDCGTSSLTVYNPGSGGLAVFIEGASSSLGWIVYVRYNVNWNNWDTGVSSYVSNGMGWGGGSTWSNNDYPWTGRGWVTATMNGWVLLAWGGTCIFIPPSDGAQIT